MTAMPFPGLGKHQILGKHQMLGTINVCSGQDRYVCMASEVPKEQPVVFNIAYKVYDFTLARSNCFLCHLHDGIVQA